MHEAAEAVHRCVLCLSGLNAAACCRSMDMFKARLCPSQLEGRQNAMSCKTLLSPMQCQLSSCA